MKNYKLPCACLAVSLFLVSCAVAENPKILNEWHVSYATLAMIDETLSSREWRPLGSLGNIEKSTPESGSHPAVWLKAEFILSDPALYYGITMDEVNLWEKTFVNGFLISPDHSLNGTFDQPRDYAIPPGVLKAGPNTVYIHLSTFKSWTLGISGTIALRTAADFNTTMRNHKIGSEYVPIAISVLILGIIISLLIKYFFNKEEKEHLLLAMRLVLVFLIFISIQFPYRIFSIDFSFCLWNIVTPMILMTFFLYYQSIYRLYFTVRNRIMTAFYLVVSLLGILNYVFFYDYDFSPYLLVINFPVFLISCLFLLMKMNSIKKDYFNFTYIAIELGAVLCFILSLLFFFLADVRGWNDPSFMLIIMSAVISINTILYYARRDGRRRKILLELSKKYKAFQPEKGPSVSESAGDKLKVLMKFIGENYMNALTRESLAELVGMNPNYLSSIFNTFTGGSLSEYINRIRIKAASEMLLQGGKQIIEIAFAAGFYSLATFNRSFKKIMKTTPSRFRTSA